MLESTQVDGGGLADKFEPLGLTFDDVLLVPGPSEVLPTDADVSSFFARDIKLAVPLVSAAMDTVTDARMAIAMARLGGIGVLHRNMPVEQQVAAVTRLKRSQSGMILDPVVLPLNAEIGDALDLMAHYHVSGVPIVDGENVLQGIVTNRDLRFLTDMATPVAKVMTRTPLVTARPGTTLDDARLLLGEHKIEKLPITDEDGHLVGLITAKDIRKAEDHPNASLDEHGRLRVAAAVGAGPTAIARALELVAAGVDAVVVDTAHGHSKMVVDTVRELRSRVDTAIVAGNVATAAGTIALAEAGADTVKIGIGPGSICTTRVVAGVGVPQISAVYNCAAAAHARGLRVIADGGVRFSGDVAKAVAAGADTVMVGGLIAGCDESPGDMVVAGGQHYKQYRGMGSMGAMGGDSHSKDRYFQAGVVDTGKLVPEGVEGRVRYRGPLSAILYQLVGGLRAGMGYCGAATVADMQEIARFVPITAAGVRESHPHDVEAVVEAPNYRPESRDV